MSSEKQRKMLQDDFSKTMEVEGYIRSPRDINKVINHAKLSVDELTSTTQTIFFSNDEFDPNDIKFLELDKCLLDTLTKNEPLILKGEDNEHVVLCTKDRTYDIKEAEVSDSLLLIPDLEYFSAEENVEQMYDEESRPIIRKDVIGIYSSYVEAKICPPRIEKLHKLLNMSKYKGPEKEYEVDQTKLYSYDELLAKIQASEKEFDEVLRKCKAIEIENKIRILDFQYHFRVLSYMLDLIQENSWQIDEIDKDETINSLKEIVPEFVLEKLFEIYTEPSKMVNGKQFYKYNEYKTCRFLAEALLQNSGKLALNDFLHAWKESVPEGMQVNEEMLYGLAIIDREKVPNSVRLLYEETLPENINERFKMLFKINEHWTKEQIVPYIERLATPKLDVNIMLTKYSRAANINGIRMYTAKHGK